MSRQFSCTALDTTPRVGTLASEWQSSIQSAQAVLVHLFTQCVGAEVGDTLGVIVGENETQVPQCTGHATLKIGAASQSARASAVSGYSWTGLTNAWQLPPTETSSGSFRHVRVSVGAPVGAMLGDCVGAADGAGIGARLLHESQSTGHSVCKAGAAQYCFELCGHWTGSSETPLQLNVGAAVGGVVG